MGVHFDEHFNYWRTFQCYQIFASFLNRNQSVRGLLITGSGKFFSNGIDLQWLGQQQAEATGQFMSKLQDLMRRILVFPVPTAALINGMMAY